jgi:hypothetical protein
MHRALLLGLPIARSMLYERGSIVQPCKRLLKRKSSTLSFLPRPPVSKGSHEGFNTVNCRHQATRRRSKDQYISLT